MGDVHEMAIKLLVGWWAVVGLVVIVRAVPPFSGWTARGIKPWACDLCSSFWTALTIVGVDVALGAPWDTLVLVPALTGLGIATLTRLTPAPAGSIAFPDLEDRGSP